MKYIITNYPAILLKSGFCFDCPKKKVELCEYKTDCLLKQIVEKCKGVQEKFYDAVHSRYLSPSKAKFAREILDLLQIQEVE